MGRALIADPFLPRKVLEGKVEEITPCIRCLGCCDSDNLTRHMICSVNPLIGREARLGFGEDMAFCIRAKELGYPLWCDSSIQAGHIGFTTYKPEDGMWYPIECKEFKSY